MTRLMLGLAVLLLACTLIGSAWLSSSSAFAATQSTSFAPSADSYVYQSSPDTNYGTSTSLRLDQSPIMRAYLRFSVQGLPGTVSSATLRLYTNSDAKTGITVSGESDHSWTESGLTYNNSPAAGSAIQSVPAFSTGTWASIDVKAYVTGNGTWDFVVTDRDSTQVALASREDSTHAPQLVIETSNSTSATPTPSPTPLKITPTATPGLNSTPAFDHIFVIVDENHSYSQIIGSSSAPYINSLATQYGLATNYYAIRHPSLPNYLALIGGSTFGITTDCSPSSCPINAPNLADRIEAAGRTWMGYMESMSSACETSSSGDYMVRHDPFVYFNDIRTNSSRCAAHVVPYTHLSTDLSKASTTPAYAWISPNVCHDMHDCSVSSGDSWLKNQLPAIFNSPAWTTQNSVLFLTWDEDGGSSSNHIATVVVGPSVKGGYRSATRYDHYSLLATIEAAWHLPALTANDAGATPMNDFWK